MDDSPEFKIGTRSYPVLDLSMKGMRIAKRGAMEFRKLQEIEGKIHFKNDTVAHVKGMIVRVHSKSLAVELSKDIPGTIIMEEQRLLLVKYRGRDQ